MNKTLFKPNKFTIPNIMSSFYNEMHISPLNILREYAISTIYSKIGKYESESHLFEKKYKCSFEQFKKKVESMENKENFQWEDDLMDWEFAFENIKYWQNKLKEIEKE